MTDDEQLLEECLDSISAWQSSLSDCADRYEAEHSDVVADLRLAQRLGRLEVPEHELAGARARVRLMLLSALAADAASHPWDAVRATVHNRARGRDASGANRPLRLPVRRQVLPRPPWGAVAAAVLLLALLGGWIASSAAASTLPESPLYGLKRAEEGLALATAWSDDRRGDMLLMMAGRRLVEIGAEARAANVIEVRTLASDLNRTMRELIRLAVTMRAHHEDTHLVVAGLERTLSAENQAIDSARQSGQTILAQTLGTASQDLQSALQASGVTSPPASGSQQSAGIPSTGPAAGSGTTPATPPVPTPTAGPGGSGPTGTSGDGRGSGTGGVGGTSGAGGTHGHGHGVISQSAASGMGAPSATATPCPGAGGAAEGASPLCGVQPCQCQLEY